MKIAIIGSRNFILKKPIEEYIDELLSDDEFNNAQFISGGAKGIDSEIEEFCGKNYREIKVIRPINPANKIDYLFRNIEIITLADKIIAFWDGKSKGTKFVIDYAKARDKDLIIITEELTKGDKK